MVEIQNVSKIYQTKNGSLSALDNIDLSVKDGEFVVFRGPSGSGKTTLLLSIGGMLRPSKGKIFVNGNDVYSMSDAARARFRAENIGFVFQMFHLVPYLNVIENVLLPLSAGVKKVEPEKGRELLKRLGLAERESHKPSELSAGERQRAAVARAMLNQPKIILADEPTGNLDPDNASEVMNYLDEYHKEGGTVIVVTHGTASDSYADRIIHLRDGRIDDSEEE